MFLLHYLPQLGVVMFMRELGRRLAGTGVTTYSVHPGTVYTPLSTGCNSQVTARWPKEVSQLGDVIQRAYFRTPFQGVQTRCELALYRVTNLVS